MIKNPFLLLSLAVVLCSCEKTTVVPGPAGKDTTIIVPAAEKKTETNTTIVAPAAPAENKTETTETKTETTTVKP